MESVDSFEPVQGKLDIFKDAFEPPHPSRTMKAWERAPVSAHAPRLQGQKIWKKAGLKSGLKSLGNQDKENFNAAQAELKKEGKGSRKRIRLLGVKENIGDATWSEDYPKISSVHENITGSEEKQLDASVGAEAPAPLTDVDANALKFIPRKRTNANLVITPRKPLRQTTLRGQLQSFVRSPHPSPEEPRRRKSIRKSRRSVPAKLDAPAEVFQVEEKTTPEYHEPVKSDSTPEATSECLKSRSELDDDKREDDADQNLNDRLNILFGLPNIDLPKTEEQLEQNQDCGNDADQSPNVTGERKSFVKVPLNDLREAKETLSPSQTHPETETGRMGISRDETVRDCQDEIQTAVRKSIEIDIDHDDIQASKTVRTPKRKRGASQKGGTRRSTRATRASSVRAEDQPTSAVSATTSLSVSGDSAAQNESQSISAESPKRVSATTNECVEAINSRRNGQTQDLVSIELEQSASSLVLVHSADAECIQQSETPIKMEDAEVDDFDVSTQLILQLSTDNQQNHIVHDFELLPPATPTTSSPGAPANVPTSQIIVDANGTLVASGQNAEGFSSPVKFSPITESSAQPLPDLSSIDARGLETLEYGSISIEADNSMNGNDSMSPSNDDLPGSSTPDPSTSKLVETISENAQSVACDVDETDLLMDFVSRVKANKAAKEDIHKSERKRSLPHSPLRLPLGETANMSPSPPKLNEEFDVGPGPSPNKRQKSNDTGLAGEDGTPTQKNNTRRSTRLPKIKTPLGAPSLIPVRRLGQDGDTTVNLKRTEEKELERLTKANTRKNKGGSRAVAEILARKAEENQDPALRQRLLKEVFDEKTKKTKKERRKTVVWAEELTRYQTVEGRKVDAGKETGEVESVAAPEKKKSLAKGGVRRKIALGMASNGTPAPKRRKAR